MFIYDLKQSQLKPNIIGVWWPC